MITIDNDYMINERGFDVRANFKGHDNPSNIAEIFFKQLSFRVYDYIQDNSLNFNKTIEIDTYLNKFNLVDDFQRALAEQALYLIVNGDPTLTPPSNISYSEWLLSIISPATNSILKNLGFLRKNLSEEELFYNVNSITRQINDPTRNW